MRDSLALLWAALICAVLLAGVCLGLYLHAQGMRRAIRRVVVPVCPAPPILVPVRPCPGPLCPVRP